MEHLMHREISRDSLVAVVNNDRDLARYVDERWYRIPVRAVGRTLKPEALREVRVLALYQTTGVRNGLPSAIELWGEIEEKLLLRRSEIITDEPNHPHAEQEYHLIRLKSVERLPAPIVSSRPRRVTFLRTTREQLLHASDINDLIVGSPLEERLRVTLEGEGVEIERKFYMRSGGVVMEVDFALFHGRNALGIVCDSEASESVAGEEVPQAWRILRFSSAQLDHEFASCLEQITMMVRKMKGE